MPNKGLTDSEALHSSETLQTPEPYMPSFHMKSLIRDHSMADYAYEVILKRIKEFQDELDDEHEVALQLASFGQSITLAVTDIGYSNPSTLVFYGYVNGRPATLIQHMSQLNFLLLSVQKQDPGKPPRRIGFELPTED